MKFYQSKLLINILVFCLGLLFIVTPTALTSASLHNSNSFYPDLFLCFIFSSALNMPKTLNLYFILLLVLFSDILHMKPIGLLTLLVLTSVIILQRYERYIDHSPFYIHYLIFFIVLSCVQVVNLFLHYLLFIPKLSVLTVINQTVFTLICYPIFDIPYKLSRVNKS